MPSKRSEKGEVGRMNVDSLALFGVLDDGCEYGDEFIAFLGDIDKPCRRNNFAFCDQSQPVMCLTGLFASNGIF